MRIGPRNLLVISTSLVTLTFAVACGGDSVGTQAPPVGPTATTPHEPSATAAVTEVSGRPSVERIMVHIEMLAEEIGARVAGSAAEREAAAYISDVLTAAGYETTIERFTYVGNYDESRVVVPGDEQIGAFMLDGSASGNAHGAAVFGGAGRSEDLADVDVQGNVLVLDRGMIPFADKVRNAEEAGAIAVVIVNNEPGAYQGTLGDLRSGVPVVGVDQAVREQLADVAGNGMLTVIASGGRRERESQNVVGRTEEPCVGYLGAHYDSVAVSPGANDNASGVGMILELARGRYTEGLCIIAFGAEEVGLWGSQAFVESKELDDVEFVLNFDMVAKLNAPVIIGDDRLTRQLLDALGSDPGGAGLRAGSFPPFASSDHVSFTAVGIPAVTVHSGDDEYIHQARDDIENVDEASITAMLRSTERMLSALLPSNGMQ